MLQKGDFKIIAPESYLHTNEQYNMLFVSKSKEKPAIVEAIKQSPCDFYVFMHNSRRILKFYPDSKNLSNGLKFVDASFHCRSRVDAHIDEVVIPSDVGLNFEKTISNENYRELCKKAQSILTQYDSK